MWSSMLLADLRYAGRRLLRERAFAVTAILTLAVGIGASTAIFTIVQAVLLRPLGMTEATRVVMLWPADTQDGTVGELSFSAQREMRERLRSFDDVAVVGSVNWSGTIQMPDGQPLGLSASAASASFFDVLGARPLLGRTFRSEDDAPSAPRVLVLSHAVWSAHFGANPAVVGQVVRVKEEGPAEPFEIIGVMPPEFFFPDKAGYWTPAGRRLSSISRHNEGGLEWLLDRLLVFHAVGRLTPGSTHATARAETDLLRSRARGGARDRADRLADRVDAGARSHLRPGSSRTRDPDGCRSGGPAHRLHERRGPAVRTRGVQGTGDGRSRGVGGGPKCAHAAHARRMRGNCAPRRARWFGGRVRGLRRTTARRTFRRTSARTSCSRRDR
jgi:hypothetical protein